MNLDRTSMLYGTALLTFTGILSQLLGFFYRILLSRMIGAEVMGLYQLLMPVYAVLMSLTATGLTSAVSALSSSLCANGHNRAVVRLLHTAEHLFLLLFLPVSIGLILLNDPIAVSILGDARTQTGLLLLLPCVLLTGIENLHKHLFYGIGNVGPPAVSEVCEQLVRTTLVLCLLIAFLPQNAEHTVGLIVLGMTGCEICSVLSLFLQFRKLNRKLAPDSSQLNARQLQHRLWNIALPVGLTSLLGNLMGAATAIMVPRRLVAAGASVSEAMSDFGILCGMTIPMLFMPTAFISAIGLVLVPKLARSLVLGHHREIRFRMDRVIQAASVLVMPFMVILTVLGPSFGTLLFHESRVGQFSLSLSVGVIFICYQSILSCALNGLGKPASAACSAIISDAVQLVCTWLLMGIPGAGLKGYVAGFVLGAAAGTVLDWQSIHRATGLQAQIFRWYVAPSLAALLAGLCGNLLFRILSDSGLAILLSALSTSVFIGLLYYAALAAQGIRIFHTKT